MAYRRTPEVQRNLDAKRDRLIESAIALVAEHGYGECSIAAVAQRSEVGTGTVYRHFANKGELFAEVFRIVCSREVAAAIAAGTAAHEVHGTYVSSVTASVATFAERALRAPTLAYALLAEPVDPQVDAERLLFRESYRNALAVAIDAAVGAGEIPPQPAQITAACIVGAIGEALILPLAIGNAEPTTVESFLTFTLRSLGSPYENSVESNTRGLQPGTAADRLRRG